MSIYTALAVLLLISLNAGFVVHVMMRIMVERINARQPGSWSQIWNNPFGGRSIFLEYDSLYPDGRLAKWTKIFIAIMMMSGAGMVLIAFLYRVNLNLQRGL